MVTFGRFDVNLSVHHMMIGRDKRIFHAVGNRVAFADRHIAGHLNVDVDPQPQAALPHAAHINSGNAFDLRGDIANFFNDEFR